MRKWKSVLVVISVIGLGGLLASILLGLGDGEALYYCYGRNPSLSYLDHPPLIGWLLAGVTSLFGTSVIGVRIVPLVMMMLAVLFTFRLSEEAFGEVAADGSVWFLLATPIFSVGMVAATPDAPLVALWTLYTLQLYRAGGADTPGFWHRVGRPILLGALLGLAFLAKYTGAMLVISTMILLPTRSYRKWLGRPGFYLGVMVAFLLSLPVFIWNGQNGFSGLYHRLVWSQGESGFSLRNLGALLGGQLLYVGPFMLILFAFALGYLWRMRRENRAASVLLAVSLPALVGTYLLALWSKVAEPHWPAPAYLPLFVAAAGFVAQTGKKKLARGALAFGVVALFAIHLLVLTPALVVLTPSKAYQREYDLGNELRGWPDVARRIRRENPEGYPVVAGFYTQCAQLTFALSQRGDPPVRCVSDTVDDFDLWYPSFRSDAGPLWFVTDNRFDFDVPLLLPGMTLEVTQTVTLERAGIAAREFTLTRWVPKSTRD